MNKKLRLEGYNYTKGESISLDKSLLDYFWKKEGNKQEIIFDTLEITENGECINLDLSSWPLSYRDKLFDLCENLPISHIKILKEYAGYGYSPKVLFEIMEENYFYIVSFGPSITNLKPEDALFEYLEETGYFEGIPDEIKTYFDKEYKYRDWEISEHPIIEIEKNTFAILFRRY